MLETFKLLINQSKTNFLPRDAYIPWQRDAPIRTLLDKFWGKVLDSDGDKKIGCNVPSSQASLTPSETSFLQYYRTQKKPSDCDDDVSTVASASSDTTSKTPPVSDPFELSDDNLKKTQLPLNAAPLLDDSSPQRMTSQVHQAEDLSTSEEYASNSTTTSKTPSVSDPFVLSDDNLKKTQLPLNAAPLLDDLSQQGTSSQVHQEDEASTLEGFASNDTTTSKTPFVSDLFVLSDNIKTQLSLNAAPFLEYLSQQRMTSQVHQKGNVSTLKGFASNDTTTSKTPSLSDLFVLSDNIKTQLSLNAAPFLEYLSQQRTTSQIHQKDDVSTLEEFRSNNATTSKNPSLLWDNFKNNLSENVAWFFDYHPREQRKPQVRLVEDDDVSTLASSASISMPQFSLEKMLTEEDEMSTESAIFITEELFDSVHNMADDVSVVTTDMSISDDDNSSCDDDQSASSEWAVAGRELFPVEIFAEEDEMCTESENCIIADEEKLDSLHNMTDDDISAVAKSADTSIGDDNSSYDDDQSTSSEWAVAGASYFVGVGARVGDDDEVSIEEGVDD